MQVELPQHLSWILQTDTDVLKASRHAGGASLPFNIACKTDAVVVVAHRARLFYEGCIAATVDMKKKVVKQSRRQTKVTYICASLKSHLPVISCVTDWGTSAAAYYTTGQKRPSDGATIILERIFDSPAQMLRFLANALSAQSVPPNVLCWKDATRTVIELPGGHPR